MSVLALSSKACPIADYGLPVEPFLKQCSLAHFSNLANGNCQRHIPYIEIKRKGHTGLMNKTTIFFGGFLIFIGLFFLLGTLDIIWFSFGDLVRMMFPLILISFGIWLIIRKKEEKNRFHHSYEMHAQSFTESSKEKAPEADTGSDPSKVARDQADAPTPTPLPLPRTESFSQQRARASGSSDSTGKISYSKMLGDMLIDCEGVNMGNVEVSMGLGDLEIKLKRAKLSSGLNRMIVSGFIGDIRIYIPHDLPFFAHCSNFIGDIDLAEKHSSGFGNTVEYSTEDYEKAKAKLYIAANCFIGDLKLFRV